ncbi:MAG TPA: alpha-L-arabinofuranosidase C-terminal domain-containing protein [Bacteroidales bacterium]|nr:alpha-L-arabinofuranosidase C-terminal domain-containing protein [Bacteroidales bacterium]
MKKSFALFMLLSSCMQLFANEPDSVSLFSYATTRNSGHNGLHFAWSMDDKDWRSIGPEHGFVTSDFGAWGSQKRMLTPYLTRDDQGIWHALWSLNETEPAIAHASSDDLVHWRRQAYPVVSSGNVILPEMRFDAASKQFIITWENSLDNKLYGCETKDFKTLTPTHPVTASSRMNNRKTLDLAEGNAQGVINRVSWAQVSTIIKFLENRRYWDALNNERMAEDGVRFANLQPLEVKLDIRTASSKPISDLLTGVFFEDINYAADGGLYGELLENRDFEYTLSDKDGRDRNWTSTHSWSLEGSGSSFIIDTILPIHPNNPHYAILKTTQVGAGLMNIGWEGIVLKKGEKYDLSLFGKVIDGKGSAVTVNLVSARGDLLAMSTVSGFGRTWKKKKVVLTANDDVKDARLVIKPLATGSLGLDMISLFPQNTFMGRKNGLRKDLAQTIADIHPKFIRFPGGCVSHGDGIGNIYQWKKTIGPLEARKPQRNIWNYHQSAGLGYYEYFQYCEDIGAQPLPVLAAGVPCQNSHVGGPGQQGGIPMCEMDHYVQDVLDLIEWANGDAKITKWGKIRAQSGHPKPFNLKYVGIGNEDLITDVFEERFTMIFNAIKAKNPEITVIGTVGPFYEGTDYEEGWDLSSKLKVPMVDEHYYVSPGWMINHQCFYDNYDRSKPKVYLGEYAAHLPGRPNNLETALAEALYLTSLERNGDVVSMASYAPLLAKDGHTQWNPNLIYFNNSEVRPTTGYQVQKLYGVNHGDQYLTNLLSVPSRDDKVHQRIASSVVHDSKTGDLIVKLVNLLPVTLKTQVKMDAFEGYNSKAERSLLTGKPKDMNLVPVVDEISVGSEFTCELPGYSFTVIRIKKQPNNPN